MLGRDPRKGRRDPRALLETEHDLTVMYQELKKAAASDALGALPRQARSAEEELAWTGSDSADLSTLEFVFAFCDCNGCSTVILVS